MENKGTIEVVIVSALAAIVVAITSGCARTTGWQVGFGVYPVTQIQNQQSLTAQPKVVRVRDTRDE